MYFESHLASLLITGSLGILQGNLNWDLPLTKVAQNKILNIFRQRKSFELSLLVGSPTISFLSLTWFSKISLEAGHLSRCWNRGENMKILWNNNGVYQNVEDWPMPSDANIIYLYTLALTAWKPWPWLLKELVVRRSNLVRLWVSRHFCFKLEGLYLLCFWVILGAINYCLQKQTVWTISVYNNKRFGVKRSFERSRELRL